MLWYPKLWISVIAIWQVSCIQHFSLFFLFLFFLCNIWLCDYCVIEFCDISGIAVWKTWCFQFFFFFFSLLKYSSVTGAKFEFYGLIWLLQFEFYAPRAFFFVTHILMTATVSNFIVFSGKIITPLIQKIKITEKIHLRNLKT